MTQWRQLLRRSDFLKAAAGGATSLLLTPLLSACGGGDAGTSAAAVAGSGAREALAASTAPPAATDATSLAAEEIAALRFMREEEKLAHDVYVAMDARWGAAIFSNIASSETEHTQAVLARLVAYGIDDPAAGRAPGEFENADLQALYDTLVERGNASLEAALGVGAYIEETDVRDIRAKMAVTDEADVLQVFQNLLCGSYKHLQAFNRQLVNLGISYVAQTISQDEWDAIVAGTASCTG